MKKQMDDAEYGAIIKKFHYSYYKFYYTERDRMRVWRAIVIRYKEGGLIAKFTGYEDLLAARIELGIKRRKPNREEIICICQFLQYVLIDNYERFRIRDIREVTKSMVQLWLNEYASKPTRNGYYPREQTIVFYRNTVCQLLWMLCHMYAKKMKYLRKSDVLEKHYIEKITKNGYEKQNKITLLYKLYADCYDTGTGLRKLNRDMPGIIIPLFIRIAEVHDPEMVLAIVLSSYMGFREGEICNVRQDYSIFGQGFYFTREEGEVTSIQVNLLKEYPLRSDGIPVGSIKRKRTASAFGAFVPVIAFYYQRHMELIKDKPCEDSKPMFFCRYKSGKTGVYMAMTVDDYRKRINRLFEKVLDYCKYSDNLELQAFRDKMISMQYTWGAHAFRHWFTVRLIQYGVSVAQLQELRGDNSEKSAQDYLKEKGELYKEFRHKNDELGCLFRVKEGVNYYG